MGLTDTLIKAQKVATFKRSLAIVIGINEYQNKIPKLKTARRDAEVLAEILEKEHQYDEVVLITDETEFKPTFQNLLILLEERLPKEIKPTKDDRLLFYFAGHGIARDSDKGPAGCLVPQDADVEKSENLLPMQKLHECLTALSCRHLLVILDCCFAGTFRWSSTRLATVIPRVVHKEHYDRFIKSPAWQAITSAAHNQEALDVLCDNRGGANHSPFAEGLFKALRGEGDLIPAGKKGQPPGDGVITAAELYLYLRDHVELSSQERQTPGIWTLSKHDRGEFIFLVPGADLKLKPAPTLHENNNPYRGLSAFEEEHSQFFFGRQELIEELYQRIAHTDESYSQLTVVLGTSGSGKSSLVKAGLIPCLRLKYSQYWCILKPMRPGESPFTALARTILPITNVPVTNQLENLDFISEILQEKLKRLDQEIYDTFDGAEEGTDKRIRLEQEENKFKEIADSWNYGTPDKRLLLVVEQFEELNNLCRTDDERERLKQAFLDSINPLSERLQSDSKQFIEIIAAWSQQHLGVKLLLVIDQFEELITLSRNTQDDKQNSKPNESQQFLKLLEETLAATLPQLCIIVTLRSDFEPRFLSSEALKSYWTQARFPVRAMRSDELRQAIERPATEMALYFEPSNLVDKLIDEVGQMPGALPLLSFTLSELYLKLAEKWTNQETTDRALTLDADFDKEGGVAGSLTRRANQEYDGLPDDAHRTTMRRVMLRMVTLEGGESARRRVPLWELKYGDKQDPNRLDEEENKRVELVLERLNHARLIVCGQETGEPYVEPAHDFLVRSWDKLQKWQQEEQEDLPLQRRLTPAALEWKRKEQSSSLLGKTEPVLSWADKKLDSVEDWLNQIKKDAQERRQERKGQFLWNGNPYLDVLKKRLKSYDYWFNQVETEFVQQSVWQRRRNINLRWFIAIVVGLGLSGLTIIARIAQNEAQKQEIDALRQASEATWLVNNQLDALIQSLRAGKNLKENRFFPGFEDSKQREEVVQRLRKVVYGITERNRLNKPIGELLTVTPDHNILVQNYSEQGTRYWNSESKAVMPPEFKVARNLINYNPGIIVSPDGKLVATADIAAIPGSQENANKNANVSLWDWENKKQIVTFSGHQSGVKSFSFSPDSKILAVVDGEDSIHLWNVEIKTQILNIKNPKYLNIVGIGFTPDNDLRIATFSQESQGYRVLKLWDTKGNQLFKIYGDTSSEQQFSRAIFSANGKQIAIEYGYIPDYGTDGTRSIQIFLWNYLEDDLDESNVNKEKFLNQLNSVPVEPDDISFAVSPDEKQIATTLPNSDVRFWDLEDPNLDLKEIKHRDIKYPIISVSLSADGKQLATADKYCKVGLLNLETNKFISIPIEAKIVSLSADSKKLAIVGENNTVGVWDLGSKKITSSLQNDSSKSNIKSINIKFSPNSNQLAIERLISRPAIQEKKVSIWDLKTNKDKIQNIKSWEDFIFNSDSQLQLLMAGTQSEAGSGELVLLTDLARNQLINFKQTKCQLQSSFSGEGISIITNSSNSNLIASGDQDTICLKDLEGNSIAKLKVPNQQKIKSISLSSDGSLMAILLDDGSIKLWQIGDLDYLLQRGCNWARRYLESNPNVKESDRHLCDGIGKSQP